MKKIDFSFKNKLDEIIGGDQHSYCFQCGACVGDCPTARYSKKFNPRIIMLKCLYGSYQDLLKENSVIWECSNCFNCYERCPQDVRPVEVIMALKNMSAQKKTNPEKVKNMVKSVFENGRTVMLTPAALRIRKELGLKVISDLPVHELREIIK